MLRSVAELQDYTIGATNGAIGRLKDFYFDDTAWVIRYLVVDTGAWLSGREVLVSPMSAAEPDCSSRTIPVVITREQVSNSPGIDTAKPVSRQHEMEYLDYYRYPYYWGGPGYWGGGYYPNAQAIVADRDTARRNRTRKDDLHLRSCEAVAGYHIRATDGQIGHVHGYILDTDTWAIRYLVIDTSNWWLGHQVLIAPLWISRVNWEERSVAVELSRQAVWDGPAYDYMKPLDRIGEVGIYQHYGRTGYWTTEPRRNAA